ncbi:uncharacterized protein KGF55_005232 [Candida pseudojiufengensis]|uniref:uncharacterized protein n=1 Tax=Candida pseudojiufengensis TaxID=497109 RepID=UPI002224F42B|nr:uncharacterized protein KGF55_005232 [Candida pseudojiufengensis]KAI5959588.1 hypothetical protein KGF55_005232 [Candida pseudojiufengensis]
MKLSSSACLYLITSTIATKLLQTPNKICNPNPKSIIPFTGFKIFRQYKISGYKNPMSMHFLTLAHCNHGQIDYQKVIRTTKSSEVDWSIPICLLKPKLGEKLITLNSFNIDDPEPISDQLNLELLSYVNNKSIKLKKLLRKKIDLVLEKLTNGKWIEYSGKSKSETFENFKTNNNNNNNQQHINFNINNLQNSFKNLEDSNLICYKLARRKKYAKRKISFFMPYTFVGGIFECLVSSDIKNQMFQNILNEEDNNLQNLNSIFLIQSLTSSSSFKCDPILSRPISPLIAEDSTNQWFTNNLFNFLNPYILQNIPYLSTTTPINLRFSMYETSDMFKDTWATKIEINENYLFDEADLHFLTKFINYFTNFLNKLIAPIDFDLFWNKLSKGDAKEDPNILSATLNEKKNFNWLSFDQKVYLVMNKFGNNKLVNTVLTRFEKQLSKIKD